MWDKFRKNMLKFRKVLGEWGDFPKGYMTALYWSVIKLKYGPDNLFDYQTLISSPTPKHTTIYIYIVYSYVYQDVFKSIIETTKSNAIVPNGITKLTQLG